MVSFAREAHRRYRNTSETLWSRVEKNKVGFDMDEAPFGKAGFHKEAEKLQRDVTVAVSTAQDAD